MSRTRPGTPLVNLVTGRSQNIGLLATHRCPPRSVLFVLLFPLGVAGLEGVHQELNDDLDVGAAATEPLAPGDSTADLPVLAYSIAGLPSFDGCRAAPNANDLDLVLVRR
jgi:hypothetical protein